MAAADRIRVLHVHSDLLWGGVEQWLLQVVRAIDRRRFQLDLFAASVSPEWENTAADLNLNLIRSPRPRAMWSYLRRLREALRSNRYDAVHCHFIDHSGVVLREAALAGVPARIAHSHLDIEPLLPRLPVWARAYFRIQNRLVHRYANCGVAASRDAAESMFGTAWQRDRRWSVLHCGIDLNAFAGPADIQSIRRDFGFGPEHVVFGHVGRFSEQKNHEFLVDVAASLVQRMPAARFLCIGEGPLESDIRQRVAAAGLSGNVVFAGTRPDAARVLRSVDAFLFPSRWEGLGLALVEAQAAGLRCFVSDAVPAEATVAPDLVWRLQFGDGAEHWATVITDTLRRPAEVAPAQALEAVRGSVFNIERSVRSLEALYDAFA
jgi:glycosyltransferase involved in cell wall biosynthesis